MASSKLNIFSSLAHHNSDSEEEGDFKNIKSKKTDKKDTSKKTDDKTKAKDNRAPTASGAAPLGVGQRQEKEQHARAKEQRKEKGVTDEPHPLDRHSGHGNQAFGTKPKKGGAGRGNWGKNPDEKVTGGEGEERSPGAEEEGDEKAKEEEKPTLTLQEYYQQRGVASNQSQVNEAKAKITSEDLMKELGTSTLLKNRAHQEVDDRKAGKKKERLDVDHRAVINTEHADLLNFRTGFVEKEYRKRGEETGDQKRGGKPTGGRTQGKEEGKEEETPASPTKQEGEVAEGAVTGEQATGEQAGEQQEAGQGAQGGQPRRGGRGGRGGQRGGDRQYQGARRGGPSGAGKQGSEKINFEDESAFPKLG